MERLREIEQLSARNAELELLLLQRTFELEILSELSHQVSYLLGDKDLLSLLVKSLDRVLPIDVAAGLIAGPGDLQLVVHSTRPLSESAQAEIQDRLLEGLTVMNGLSPMAADISVQCSQPSSPCPPLQRLDSMVMVPMLVETIEQPDHPETVGMLLIGATEPNVFTQNHLRFLYTVANQGAVSLGRLRSHLSAEKNRLEQVTTHFSEGVIIVDHTGHILFANPMAQGLLRHLADIDHQHRLRRFAHKPLQQWLLESQHPPHWQELPSLYPTQPLLELMVQPGTSLATAATADYVTLIIREDRAKQNLEQLKDQLIATISHELRTPLTLIYAPLEMLASGTLGALTEDGLQVLEIAIQSANQLKQLIDNILALNQLEMELLTLQFEPCNVQVLVEKAMALMVETAAQERITLSITQSDPDRTCPTHICRADPDYILQVLKHLLENAIKYSDPDSQVVIEVTEQSDCLLISVQDQGIGISEEQLAGIFARFQQGDGSRCRTYNGLGIGLAICDRIIQLHGGEIWAESVAQQGSTFYFTLPKTTPLS